MTTDKRLLLLARFLEQLPPDRFNFRHWVGSNWQGAQDLSCGTTACALGWAATIPEFRALGLRLMKGIAGDGFVGLVDPVDEAILTRSSGEAAERVFGLEEEEALFLFEPRMGSPDWWPHYTTSPDGNATAKEVAIHIRNFVNERAFAIASGII